MTAGPGSTLSPSADGSAELPPLVAGEATVRSDDAAPGADARLGVFGVLDVLLSHWRVLIFVPLALAAVAAIAAFNRAPSYTATAVFVPEAGTQSRVPGSIAGIAGQFGINLGGDGSRSAAFYAEIAKSRDILARVLLSTFPDGRATAAAADSATLLELYAPEGDSLLQIERGIARLSRAMSLEVDIPTSLVRLSVTDGDPAVAAAVANRVVAVMDDFNTDSRQSQARRRREFIEKRATEAGAELRRAERALDEFQERNRAWQQSPQLTSAQARLRREVDLRQEVYLTLGRELETARIEEVNDAPVISVIQQAVPPQFKSAPRRAVIIVLGGTLGVLLALCWVGAAELFRRLRVVDGDGYRALAGRLGVRRHRGPRVAPDASA